MTTDPGHVHDHSHADLQASPGVRRALGVAVAVVAALTLVGLLAWRPSDPSRSFESVGGAGDRVEATVTGEEVAPCAGTTEDDAIRCIDVDVELTSGAHEGQAGTFQVFPGPGTPDFEPGDDLVLYEVVLDDGTLNLTFADRQRDRPLVLLAVLFVLAVVALGRLQGLRALLGLVISGLVLLQFIFPALLDGRPPLGVALVGASVIAFAALYLAHGVTSTTTVALLGTFAALGITGVLGVIFTRAAQITGLASEDQITLAAVSEGIDVRGLVLAGIVLGSLGVLDDVTVTQVSAVARLREANPGYGVRELYRSALTIGRDHIASTVNTLVLAYAGASLPLLLYFSNVGFGLGEAATSEVVGVEIIRTLVGSIGLVSAVPITTLLAAVVVTGTALPGRDRGRARAAAAAHDHEPPEADWQRFAPDDDLSL